MEIDRLARMREKDPELVGALRLQHLDRVIALGNGVGPVGGVAIVESVDFLAQNRAAQSPARLAHFLA